MAGDDRSQEGAERFAVLLRRYRELAGLAQEELAERAGLSAKAIGALERGDRRRPHPSTVRRLSAALGLSDPERAHLLASVPRPPAVTARPPAPAAPHPTLPAPPTALLGRDTEVTRLGHLLRQRSVRLVTLIGPGGVGKTRLALQVAADLGADFPDGVVFVPLASLGQPDFVGSAIARALAVRERGERPLADSLVANLRPKHLLLVLDNFEHVVAAAPLVAELLAGCPDLTVLATSRSLLALRGEQPFRVRPLALPEQTSSLTTASLMGSPATALFLQRACEVKPAFAPTAADAPAIAAICSRLDGLPLAIELAATRIKLLSPPALLARLERRLPLLTGGARDLPSRQQTLRATLAWSYALLPAPEQALFRRLAVFRKGGTLEAAAAVAGSGLLADRAVERGGDVPQATTEHAAQPSFEVLAEMASLIDASLLEEQQLPGGEVRVAMLETIREYALEQLEASGEAEALRKRHAAYYLQLAEAAEPELQGAKQAEWFNRLEWEHDNLRAALAWFRERGLTERWLRLAAALFWFWYGHGYWTEGRQWLEGVVAAPHRVPARVRALYGLGAFSALPENLGRARACFEESVELARQLGDRRGLTQAVHALGILTIAAGDRAAARALLEQALAIARAAGEDGAIAATLSTLGQLTGQEGDVGAARAQLEESVRICRALGNRWTLAHALNGLGDLARSTGEDQQAARAYEESLHLFRELDIRDGQAGALHNLAYLAHHQGDEQRAAQLFRDALRLFGALGDRRGIAECLVGLAGVSGAVGQPAQAAHLIGAAEGLLDVAGACISPSNQIDYERDLSAIRARLGTEAFAAARAVGQATALEQVRASALELGPVEAPARRDPARLGTRAAAGPQLRSANPGGLTDREVEVLRLLQHGLTYQQIADRLGISPRTVNRHLTVIYGKLGVTSRHQATLWAGGHLPT